MFKNKFLIPFFIMLLPVAYFFIVNSGVIDKSKLTSKTWHSTMNILMAKDNKMKRIFADEDINKVELISDIRYLLDGSYIHNSEMNVYNYSSGLILSMNVSNVGDWEYEQGYLFLTSDEVKNFMSGDDKVLDSIMAEKLKKVFLIHMLETQRMTIIDDDTLLMTSVDKSSRLWVAN